MGYIYLITNKINNKQYIGQTICNDIETRWKQHKRSCKYSLGRYILSAYKKYGIENFKFQIICICFDEDCNKYEEEYIKKYNTLSPNGYNLTEGGKNAKHTEETRKLISAGLKSVVANPEWGKRISERQSGEKHFNYCGHLSEEHKKKIGEKSKNYWKNMSTEKIESIIKKRKETMTINGKYIISEKQLNALKEGNKLIRKKVGKFTKENELLETYESITDASIKNNKSMTTISRICHKKKGYSHTGGFVYKFI